MAVFGEQFRKKEQNTEIERPAIKSPVSRKRLAGSPTNGV